MIEGIVTVEIVPSGTTNRELKTGKARRALLVVPVDGMSRVDRSRGEDERHPR